jgi:hypothetical protein
MKCLNFKNFFNFLGKRESLIIFGLIIINILNLVFLSTKPHLLLIANVVLLGAYFLVSQREDKKILLIASINFAIWGIILESFIIQKTNFALRYKINMGILYVPGWLFTIYMIFMISALFTYDAIKQLVK